MWELIQTINDALTVAPDAQQAFGFLAALPAIGGALGKIFGGAAGGKSDQRMQESQQINQQNRNALDRYGIQQGAQMQAGSLDLNRKGFGEQARGGRAKQALIASLLQNMKDVNVNVPGITPATITGGLRPSALGAGGQEVGGELYRQALAKLMQGDQFEGGNVLQAPTMQGMPKQGGLEKFLNLAGLIGSGIGGVGAVLKPEPKE